MTTAKDILALHKRRDERDALVASGKIDSNHDDNHLAQLGESQGWEILKAKMEKRISELLEPGIGDENVSLEMVGAVTLAREFAITALTELIKIVETTKAVKKIERQEKNIEPEQETQ